MPDMKKTIIDIEKCIKIHSEMHSKDVFFKKQPYRIHITHTDNVIESTVLFFDHERTKHTKPDAGK